MLKIIGQYQEMNEVSKETYDQTIDNYASNLEDVADLEIVIPDDMEEPENAEIPQAMAANAPSQEKVEGKDKDKNRQV